jgi:hypothetical protein
MTSLSGNMFLFDCYGKEISEFRSRNVGERSLLEETGEPGLEYGDRKGRLDRNRKEVQIEGMKMKILERW